MTQELSDESRKASMMLEHILSDSGQQDVLLASDRRPKREIAERLVAGTEQNPIIQTELLKAMIGILSQESDDVDVDKRDTTFELLKQPPFVDLFESQKEAILNGYFDAVSHQTQENDPFAGSIASLLDAGLFLAPYFPQDDLSRVQLENLWKHVAEKFPYGEEREYIKSCISPILERMTKEGSRLAKVEYLRLLELKNKEIGKRLGLSEGAVEQEVGKLIALGRLESRRGAKSDVPPTDIIQKRGGRPRSAINIELERIIKRLIRQGISKSELKMVPNLPSEGVLEYIIARLKRLGEIPESWTGRFTGSQREESDSIKQSIADDQTGIQSPEDALKDSTQEDAGLEKIASALPGLSRRKRWVDSKVEPLARRGLTEKTVSLRLGIDMKEIRPSFDRLREQGKIEKVPRRTKEQIEKDDEDVKERIGRGMSVDDIADELFMNPSMVKHSIERQQQKETLPRILNRRNKTEIDAFDKQVRFIRDNLGMKRKQIANEYGVEERVIKESLERSSKKKRAKEESEYR